MPEYCEIGRCVTLRNWLQPALSFIRHLPSAPSESRPFKEQAELIGFLKCPPSFFFFCTVDDIHFIFFPQKNIKLYLRALISVTVNNRGLEVNKILFGMKYEVTFHS